MVWRFDQCDEGVATGMAIDLLKKERVDVLFGPPCTLGKWVPHLFCYLDASSIHLSFGYRRGNSKNE